MIINPYRYGQLGNQLFHIAHLYTAHKVNGHQVVFVGFGYDKRCFPNIDAAPGFKVIKTGKTLNCWLRKLTAVHRKFLKAMSSGVITHLCCETPPYIDTSSKIFNEACKKKLCICEGWGFRDNKHIQTFRLDIVRLLSFSNEIRNESARFLTAVKKSSKCCLVGFHIRRGDYRHYKNGVFYLSDANWRSAIDATRQVVESSGKTFRPIIFSNENCEALHDIQDIVVAKGDMYTDLQSLSSCDLIVAPPSTFSGWASFLGNVKFAQVDIYGKYEEAIGNAKPILW
jgi:hypothetical protein